MMHHIIILVWAIPVPFSLRLYIYSCVFGLRDCCNILVLKLSYVLAGIDELCLLATIPAIQHAAAELAGCFF